MARLVVKSPYIQCGSGQSADGHFHYIATRPRVERLGDHGLFGEKDGVDLDKAIAELQHYTGNVWTHILSLHREDAARLGYDNARAWRVLLRTHRNDIAAAMHIPPQNFRWYAAFHDEGKHPHVHMMAWSAKPGEGYLSKDGIREIKSALTNQIFRQEMLHVYEQKSKSRDELVRETRKVMLELSRQMGSATCDHPEAEQMIWKLAQQLSAVKGKKSYGYLPKSIKKLVDEVVDQMERLPIVNQCYQTWWDLQCQVNDFYSERERERPPLSQQKEFSAIKNAVIKEAEIIRQNKLSFEDNNMKDDNQIDVERLTLECQVVWETAVNTELPFTQREEAARLLERLAEDGDGYAQYLTGTLYRDGGLLIPDTEEARYWLEQAAKQDVPAAQYALGRLLLSDDPDVQDQGQGTQWLHAAAENGNTYAAYLLGKVYLRGGNVPRDTAVAASYFRQAAEADNPWAQYVLAKLYLTGEGVEKDKAAAYNWFQAAAAQGHPYAELFLERWNCWDSASVLLSATRLLHHMGRIFRDNAPPKPVPGGVQIDRKRLQKLREKKIALGHKPDDHEEQQTWGGMTMG